MNPSLENQEKGHLEIWSWSKDPYEPISVNVMQAVVCRIVLSRVKPYSAARGYGMFFWDSFIEKQRHLGVIELMGDDVIEISGIFRDPQ